MTSSEDCIFCKIVAGQIPSKKAYEDDEFLAFHDINPAAPVHVLVIPKQHIESLAACETEHTELIGRMCALAPRIAREQGVGYDGPDGTSGFKAMFNTGRGGGQEVYHLHLHVIGGQRPWKPR